MQEPDQLSLEHLSQDPVAQRYAREHLRFLRENRPDVLEGLRQSGDLSSYLSSVGTQASERLEDAMTQASRATGNLPYQERVTALQNHHQSAEEMIRHDLIHQPLREEAEQEGEDEAA
jgi:hypothetical protein